MRPVAGAWYLSIQLAYSRRLLCVVACLISDTTRPWDTWRNSFDHGTHVEKISRSWTIWRSSIDHGTTRRRSVDHGKFGEAQLIMEPRGEDHLIMEPRGENLFLT
jgi:hypothetical protein